MHNRPILTTLYLYQITHYTRIPKPLQNKTQMQNIPKANHTHMHWHNLMSNQYTFEQDLIIGILHQGILKCRKIITVLEIPYSSCSIAQLGASNPFLCLYHDTSTAQCKGHIQYDNIEAHLKL